MTKYSLIQNLTDTRVDTNANLGAQHVDRYSHKTKIEAQNYVGQYILDKNNTINTIIKQIRHRPRIHHLTPKSTPRLRKITHSYYSNK